MNYPISIIPYANMAPYKELGPPEGCEFVEHTPRQSTTALIKSQVLSAPVPVGDLPSIMNQADYLGSYGIASSGAVQSVLLFSNVPFDRMMAPKSIFLTDHSSTSVRLLYLLLGYRHGFDRIPYETRDPEMAHGKLLIGDQALVVANQEHGYCVTDLAEAWCEIYKLPMVFARWVIRKDAPMACRRAMLAWLERFRKEERTCLLSCTEREAERLSVSTERMLAYLESMKRVLGPEELQGQAMFLSQLEQHGHNPLFVPLPVESS